MRELVLLGRRVTDEGDTEGVTVTPHSTRPHDSLPSQLRNLSDIIFWKTLPQQPLPL